MRVNDFSLLALHRLYQNKPKKLEKRIAGGRDAGPDEMSRDIEQQVQKDLRWLESADHHLIRLSDPDYPDCLKEIWDPPPVLFGLGDRRALAPDHRVAIVGARKASAYGLKQAANLGEKLAAAGIVVVSGLAMGIDAAGHEGALAGGGMTVAVLGTGCDLVYPKRNWRLAERIAASGLLISELPLGTSARAFNFPRRNRIVTGLCAATLVVEAAKKSGSLISARLAAGEGREVMAMPGLVTNPQSRGCHQLIKEGATLIESAEDVLDELGLLDQSTLRFEQTHSLASAQQAVIACLAPGAQSIDELMVQLNQPVEEITVNLVMLEISGHIVAESGKYQLTGLDETSRLG